MPVINRKRGLHGSFACAQSFGNGAGVASSTHGNREALHENQQTSRAGAAAFARALTREPQVPLLDGPLWALDALGRGQLRDAIRRIRQALPIIEGALSRAARALSRSRGLIVDRGYIIAGPS